MRYDKVYGSTAHRYTHPHSSQRRRWNSHSMGNEDIYLSTEVDCVWNVMAHAQKPDLVFRRNVRVHLNRRGRQFSRLLAAEVFTSAVVMLDTPCSEVVWRVLATHSIRQFPLHFPSRASPCAITFQLESTNRVTEEFTASILDVVEKVCTTPQVADTTTCTVSLVLII
jgi:hypothetical protein